MTTLIVICGLLAYHLFIMSEQGKAGVPCNPIKFIKKRPYKVALSVIFALVGGLIVETALHPSGSEELVLFLLSYTPLTITSISASMLSALHIAGLFLAGFLPYWLFDKWGKRKMLEIAKVDAEFMQVKKDNPEDQTTYVKRR